ncbi:MAG: glycoside hydrolase family 16 protein [Akkermansiaceae bacterium]
MDILEFVGKDPKHIHANAHFQADGKHKSDHKAQPTFKPWDDFHLYSIEWGADFIHFAIDEKRFHSFRISKADTSDGNPFHKPLYLILNLALGGSWGGPIDNAIFPVQYLVDYVRIYQKG